MQSNYRVCTLFTGKDKPTFTLKTKPNFASSRRASLRFRGFALIVTLSLMILLSILCVGMLTLSSVTLRSTGGGAAEAEARQNAQLAMQLAISQLQLLSGQDTRITAPLLPANPADAIESVPPVTGVWRSWEGGDRQPDGKPKIPDYNSKKQGGDTATAPNPTASGRFLGWLTSSTANTTPNPSTLPDIKAAAADGYVKLVAAGSASDTRRHVYTKPTMINANKGAIAWWTSGDNSKAMVNSRRSAKPSSIVQWQQQVRSNGRMDAQTFGLEAINDIAKYPPGKVVPTTGSLELVNQSADLKKIHDLTSFNRGLLTNSSTGGWRRDLSLFSEGFASLPSAGLPLLTIQPSKVQTYSKAPTSGNVANPLLYPWAGYRNNAQGSSWEQVPPISSWTALVDYMTQYRKLTTSGASRTAMPIHTGGTNTGRFEYVDQVRRLPQIARIHWIYSLCSDRVDNPADPSKPFRAGLMITPVLTLWNPYNVELAYSSLQLRIQQTTPLRFRFRVGDNPRQTSSLADITKTDIGSYHTFIMNIPADVLRPGQTRILGLNDPTPKRDSQASSVNLTPGYQPNGGFMFFGIDKGAEVYAAGTDRYAVENVSYDGLTRESGRDGVPKEGIGIIFDFIANGASNSHRMLYNVFELGGSPVATAQYPPLTAANLPSSTVGAVEGNKNIPFASAIFAYRMASPMSRDINRHKHLFTKGMLQASPLIHYTEIGFGDDDDAVTSMKGTGVYHPVNAPYDFAFVDILGGWNDSTDIPQFERTTNSSYIVSGMGSNDGLTRCVMAELPTRPLQSLAELQHFDARYNNPITPFQFNLLGNGSAHPIFAPDQTMVTTTFNNGMCNDDTYLLNQLFFDDWFVSSIAPDLNDFASTARRSINDVYKEHLELTTPLPNRNYLPSPDAAVAGGKLDVAKAVSDAVSNSRINSVGMYPFETIASKLRVEGMFNINSASLEAWKSLLRQSRSVEVPYLGADGATKAGAASTHSYPRTSIAGDQGTDSGSKESNATFPQAVEFAGHRVLTDEQIDALAEEIVKEIRKRGPFLSLAEFVNRRLDASNTDMAIASTIQKALDNLAELGNSPKNPFRALQANSVKITSLPAGTTHDYKFPQAALGWSAFGVPGWTRQADILKPLAPVLSARDDTFTIRAYGDARDRSDPSKILARAWCEVVVTRQAAYVDPVDPAEILPHSTAMKSEANRRFGRRYEIVTFRWLNESEL